MMTVTDVFTSARPADSFAADLVEIQSGIASFHVGVIEQLRLRAGREASWHLALLQAMGQWTLTREHVAGRDWQYVIGGEALDGLTLAQRLCLEIADVVPQFELESLLFRGQWPERISSDRLRELIGPYRYTALLNFRYGVVVEEALQLVAEESIRKSRLARCYQDSEQVIEDAYRHLYGDSRAILMPEFLKDSGGTWGADAESLSLTAWQEFTYWLFKRRVRKWHPARVASDTRRGLERLRDLHGSGEHDATDSFTGGGFDPPAALVGRSA
ncbi:MAG: hypothetical protein OXI54_13645 [Chloroflexota bacterium]|nr:hypothetical protein [Chloroflexota bacterium]MDE2685173.1 hypothetical protein [Chloroflexota bacterium]